MPDRADDTVRALSYFTYLELPPRLQAVAAPCSILAYEMTHRLPDGDDLTAGLEHLLHAREAFVRAAVEAAVDGAG